MKRLALAAVTAAALALGGLGVVPATAVTASTGTVSVTVTGPGGVRLPDVGVGIAPLGENGIWQSGTTAANGGFTSADLDPGRYQITATLWSPVMAEATRTVDVTAAANVAVTLSLTGFGVIAGTVTAGGGKVSNGTVNAENVDGSGAPHADVVNGAYTMLVDPGRYTVSVAPPWDAVEKPFVTTFAGNTVRSVDAAKVLVAKNAVVTVNIAAYAKVGALKGKVVDAKGKAVRGAYVVVRAANRASVGDATTAKDGSYTVSGLPAGRYTVDAFRSYSDSVGASGAYEGGALSSKLSGKVATVKAGATVSAGRSVVRKGTTGTGRIVLKIKAATAVWKRGPVCATVMTTTGQRAGWGCAEATTKKLTIPRLAKGTYKVALDGTNTTQKIAVKSGKATTKTVTRATGTTISGTARTASGKLLKRRGVYVYDANGSMLGSVLTNAKGRFSVPGAISGKYTLVQADPETSWMDVWDSIPVQQGKLWRTITVKKGKKATTTLGPVKAAKITGKVTNAKGVGIAGVYVAAVSPTGSWLSAVTNSKGQYTITRLPKGTYRVTTRDPHGAYLDGKVVKVKVAVGTTKKVSVVRLAAG